MNYIIVAYKKEIPELPEIKAYEDREFYIAKRHMNHYRAIGIKADLWETDGETARRLNL